MEKLPPEVLENILKYLPNEELNSIYSFTNNKWTARDIKRLRKGQWNTFKKRSRPLENWVIWWNKSVLRQMEIIRNFCIIFITFTCCLFVISFSGVFPYTIDIKLYIFSFYGLFYFSYKLITEFNEYCKERLKNENSHPMFEYKIRKYRIYMNLRICATYHDHPCSCKISASDYQILKYLNK